MNGPAALMYRVSRTGRGARVGGESMTTQVPFRSGRHQAQGAAPTPHRAPTADPGRAWQQAPMPHQHPYPAPQPVPASNGLATAGFVVALIGFVLSLIPIVGTVSWLLSPVGLVLSVVGLALAGRRGAGRGLAIAGAVLGVLGLLVCILYTASFVAAVNGATPAANSPATSDTGTSGTGTAATGATGTVRYEVTGSGRGSVTWTDGSGNMGQQTSARLPWSKDVKPADGFGFYSLTVTGGTGGGEVGCRIVKDGAVIAEQSAEGRFASASCSGS